MGGCLKWGGKKGVRDCCHCLSLESYLIKDTSYTNLLGVPIRVEGHHMSWRPGRDGRAFNLTPDGECWQPWGLSKTWMVWVAEQQRKHAVKSMLQHLDDQQWLMLDHLMVAQVQPCQKLWEQVTGYEELRSGRWNHRNGQPWKDAGPHAKNDGRR